VQHAPATDAQIVARLQKKRGKTPLHAAAERGAVQEVQSLLAAGADVNAVFAQRGLRWTPLCAAVLNDHLFVVKRLLDAGAKVEGDGLHPAIWSVGSVAVAEALFAAGARVDHLDEQGYTVLARVVDVRKPLALAELIAARSPRPTAAQIEVLTRAARQSTLELHALVVRFLG
jgi:ankyrin repeat protein